MKRLFVCILVLIFSYLVSYSQEKHVLLSMQDTAWFNFWIGDWSAYWYVKDSVKETAENRIKRILNDKVILEEFKITSGAGIGFEGKSWSVYNGNTGQWYQTWVDNSGAYLDFIGLLDGGKRIFQREFVNKKGDVVKQRMVFKDITANTFTWDWESSLDGGKTWQNNWQLFYNRKNLPK
ncbi:MAG TPA: hypothetical protein PKO16_09195 [Bacteroidia bacterium]|jgi:hypothetical protein|nr:hypothetical protein [Bacteroidia bacterium]